MRGKFLGVILHTLKHCTDPGPLFGTHFTQKSLSLGQGTPQLLCVVVKPGVPLVKSTTEGRNKGILLDANCLQGSMPLQRPRAVITDALSVWIPQLHWDMLDSAHPTPRHAVIKLH